MSAATCIVCLGELDAQVEPTSLLPRAASPLHDGHPKFKRAASVESTRDEVFMIAHLRPCGHNLHDECLKPWVERANSCPICRQRFNSVDLSTKAGGMTVSSYEVADRTQVADIDPSVLVDEIFEEEIDVAPCPFCKGDDNEEVLLLCDGCDVASHTYCVGLDAVPVGPWFCENCAVQRALDPYNRPTGHARTAHHTSDRRTRGQQRRLRSHHQATDQPWARVWQSVWDNLNLDLDMPFDDNRSLAQYRRSEQTRANQRREFQAWQRRYEVAQRQGGQANMFRSTRSALLEAHTSAGLAQSSSSAEAADEERAWRAMEKAKEMEEPGSRKRKRKSKTSSPVDPSPVPEPERKLKRPNTRRNLDPAKSSHDAVGESSTPTARKQTNNIHVNRATGESSAASPSFLQSLLREVEASQASESARDRGGPSLFTPKHFKTPFDPSRSPGLSPTTSDPSSPRALSISSPQSTTRPGSPFQYTSRVEPDYGPVEYSPPHERESRADRPAGHRSSQRGASRAQRSASSHQRRKASHAGDAGPATDDASPDDVPTARGASPSIPAPPNGSELTYESKLEIQSMVTSALNPLYRLGKIGKVDYTAINCSVSRMLYAEIGVEIRSSETDKERWQKMAKEEVERSCRNVIQQRRHASTATVAVEVPATHLDQDPPATQASSPQRSYAVSAGLVLSRPPQITRDLTAFEKAFFFYQRRLNERLALPFTRYFYFKKGTPADLEWKRKQKQRVTAARDIGSYNAYSREGWNDELLVGAEESEPERQMEALLKDAEIPGIGSDELGEARREIVERPPPRVTQATLRGDEQSLERRLDRTLYLLVQDPNGRWRFPAAPLMMRETLHQASERILVQAGGANMNTWLVGRTPIGHFSFKYPLPRKIPEKGIDEVGEKTFFLKARIMAGQANLAENKLGLKDFKWLCKEEVERQVQDRYWGAVKNMLAER
ncbi:MAG: hypothetical protein M1838_004230 [Thelocarpon superellum]|nr:MAG: hypothetical protein M1838_004230 [Thelocarpon superellum]